MTPTRILIAVSLLAAAGLGGPAFAQDRHDSRAQPPGPPVAHRPPPGAPRGSLHFDQRYHHDHYYPPRGYAVPALPGGALSLQFGGGNLFFHGGVWFRPFGGRFVVTVPPVGIVVPLLPPAYVTLWIGGAPYYYANGVYYAPAPGQGYAVVNPPPEAEAAQPVPPAPPPARPLPDPVIYPRNGQGPQQTEADRQDCNRWATTQPKAMADATVFQRAVEACMDGRGYTVR